MNKDRLLKLASDPKFISGIYNYCDRWCERCRFTDRCLNYAIGQEEGHHDIENLSPEAFAETISGIFNATSEMLSEMAEEQGIDLEAGDTEEIQQRLRKRREDANNHPCAKAAMQYTKAVKEWFDNSEHSFKEKEDELNSELQLEIPDTNPYEESEEILDAVEIIRWHQHQIYVKIMRALQGKWEDEIEELKDMPKDSDGSAKVALIAIDNSIAAWEKLRTELTDEEDSILDIIIHLDKLRKDLEAEFPDARSFIRPGFDEPEKYG